MSLFEQGCAVLLVGVGLCGTLIVNSVLSGSRGKDSQTNSPAQVRQSEDAGVTPG